MNFNINGHCYRKILLNLINPLYKRGNEETAFQALKITSEIGISSRDSFLGVRAKWSYLETFYTQWIDGFKHNMLKRLKYLFDLGV